MCVQKIDDEKTPEKFKEGLSLNPASRPSLLRTLSQRVTRPFTRFYEHTHTEQAFADYIAKRLDTFLAGLRFVSVIVITILIFAINKHRYGDTSQW